MYKGSVPQLNSSVATVAIYLLGSILNRTMVDSVSLEVHIISVAAYCLNVYVYT